MRLKTIAAAATAVLLTSGAAHAECTSLDQAMQDFQSVADAFSAQAQSMSPDKFPIWTSNVQEFSDAMGKQNYPVACSILVNLVGELGLDVQLAHAGGGSTGGTASAPAAPQTPSTGDTATGTGGDTIVVAPQTGGETQQPQPQPQTQPQPGPVTASAGPEVRTGRDRSRPPRLW